MMRTLFIILSSMVFLFAGEESSIKTIKLSQKGERIVEAMCNKDKLPKGTGSIEMLTIKIKDSKACPSLSKSKLEAVAHYVRKGSVKRNINYIAVPDSAKCPVCGMFISKYPKWAASMQINGKKLFFDGVKDMMKYYIFDGDFIYQRKQILEILVSDYYTLEAIPAKEAFYVLDSDVFGPMGHELIPFKTEEKAKAFKGEHHGKAIVKFDKITDSMVMALDGIVQ